jgi:hypothetical protein
MLRVLLLRVIRTARKTAMRQHAASTCPVIACGAELPLSVRFPALRSPLPTDYGPLPGSIFQSKDEHETGFPLDRRESGVKNEEAA